jgi:hypothetical protein
MAKITRNHHENLQEEGLDKNQNHEEHKTRTKTFLSHIPDEQKIPEPRVSPLSQPIKEEEVRRAIIAAKNGSATSINGCPHELWKKLLERDQLVTTLGSAST